MRKGLKKNRCRNVSALKISLIAMLCTGLAGIPACSSQEAQTEQFNNNSTGMDRDKTTVQKDTLSIDASDITDSTGSQ